MDDTVVLSSSSDAQLPVDSQQPQSDELVSSLEQTPAAQAAPPDSAILTLRLSGTHPYTDPARQSIAFGARGISKLIDMLVLGDVEAELRAVHALSDFVTDPLKCAEALEHSEFLIRVASCLEDETAPEPLKLKAGEILAGVCRSALGASVVTVQSNVPSRLLKMLGIGLSPKVEQHLLDALCAITEQPEHCLRVYKSGHDIVRVLVGRIAKHTKYTFELTAAACECLSNVILHASAAGAADDAFQAGGIAALAQMLGSEAPAASKEARGTSSMLVGDTSSSGMTTRVATSREARICGGTRARAGAITCLRELCSVTAGDTGAQMVQLARHAGVPVALLQCASEGFRSTRFAALGALAAITTDVESKRAVYSHGGVRVIAGLLTIKGDDESVTLALKCLANLGDLPAARTEVLESAMVRLEFLMQSKNIAVAKAAREAHAVATWLP